MKLERMTEISLFAALTAAFAQISLPIPLSPVPFSLAIVAVFLCGALLEKNAAFTAQLVYLLLGGVGAPVYAGFSAGLGSLFGPTGGYLLAYPVMAWMVAWVAQGGEKKSVGRYFAGMVLALLCCYLPGTLWLAATTGMTLQAALLAGVVPFVLPDLCKAGLCAGLSVTLRQALASARSARNRS